ncbi:MAG: hypothetical protein JO023_15210 [Chloroflexi bacterium]|nr:hypothetical protein [Chloroflexota bacterium]
MREIARFRLVSSFVALASVAGSVAPAFADLSGPAPYEIEAKEQYCADGTTRCVPANQRPDLANLRFALVEVYRVTPPTGPLAKLGGSDGSLAPPQALIAKCAGPHSLDAKGNIHATTMFVFAGPKNQGFDGGSVQGSVVLSHGLESDTRSSATVAAGGSDPVSGDTAHVAGVQVANNVSDTFISGGFRVSLNGPKYDEIIAGPDFNPSAAPTRIGSSGSMTCSTGNRAVSTPGAPPPYFENEINDAPDQNS